MKVEPITIEEALGPLPNSGLKQRITGMLEMLVIEASAAEREACAKMVEGWPDAEGYTADRWFYGDEMASNLAAAIRARGNTE